MRCKELEAVLEQEGVGPLPLEAREHLANCPDCQDFFADLTAIVGAARQFPAEVDPPDRVWISLRAQLTAEGIIREQAPVGLPGSAPWWQGISEFFRPRVLASVGAGVLLVALVSVYVARRPGPPTVRQASARSQPQNTETASSVVSAPAPQPSQRVRVKTESPHSPRVSVPTPPRGPMKDLSPSPSENAFLGETAGVLSKTENDLPGPSNAMADAAMRANLLTLNEFIAECEARLKQNPQDQMTREYLNVAYQQKAELLTVMMDSGRSEH
jgi:hypothetical protein